jgi:small subunit ribosomal protein S15
VSTAKETKEAIIKSYAISQKDTGSCEVQIALLSQRISELSEHMKVHPKDLHSRRGLVRLLNLRRSLLDYLKKRKVETYRKILASLGLRK